MILTSRRAALMAILFVCVPLDLLAADHLMVIQEVFPGTPANPAAQYVMLRMTFSGQTLVSGDFVEVQDAAGTVLGRFGAFPGNVAAGGTAGCAYPNCPAILMGTTAAQTLLGFTFDTVVDAQVGRVPLPLTGGRVCFRIGTLANQIPDCVAYGNFTGVNTTALSTNACDANFGTPAAALTPGFALTRKLFSCAAKENSTDFENRFPHPVANNGGNANTDNDADGLINVLDCEDVSGSAGLYPPIGVADLSVSGGSTANWTWTPEPAPVGTSLVYDLTQMLLTDLTTRPTCDSAGAAGFFVTGAGVTGTGVQESAQPAPGEIYYYAARSRTICGSASFC